jgi:2-polyprenyl-3-methyl-5-hydroxy-6-metoxy-1,4-benzoquinol methylase
MTGMSCPLCGESLRATHVRSMDRLATHDGPFNVLECGACRLGLTIPQLDDAALAPYYSSEYYQDYCAYSGEQDSRLLHRLRARFRELSAARRHRRPPFRLTGTSPGRMLDVGCGTGDLLEDFARRGWEPYGIEPSGAGAAAASRGGARVHQGTLRDHPWHRGSFKLITFHHSLEHVPDPVDALRRAATLLEPGGLIVIVVPNWCSWQRRLLFRNRWAHLDLPRHQQHFSLSALTRFADLLDLRVKDLGTLSTVISTAYSVHFMLAGRWTPGWKLWLSYGLGSLLFPLMLLGDRAAGGDCCFIVMEAASEPAGLHVHGEC